MSDYGPAFFIKRKDKKEITEKEQKELLDLTIQIVKELKIKDNDKNIAEPEFYDYGNYEEKGIGIVIFYDFSYGQMPAYIKKDTEAVDQYRMKKIGTKINKIHPKTYEYKCYYVEVW